MTRNSVASLLAMGSILIAICAMNWRNADGIWLALFFLMASCTIAG